MKTLHMATMGLMAAAASAYALDVTAVKGPVYKFRDGADTVVYIPSNATIRLSGEGTLDALLVGGGGGGGLAGGGGGGGAVVYTQALEVAAGEYDVTVGQGGTGGYRDFTVAKWMPSLNGGDTSAFDIKAIGGGGGGSYGANLNGNVGASGGGGVIGYFDVSSPRTYTGSEGTAGLGYGGGASTNYPGRSSSCVGGGGGGAGGPGETGRYEEVTYHRSNRNGEPTNPTGVRIFGGNGGPGVMCPIWGSRTYGGGGGGARADGTRYHEVRVCLGGVGGGGAIAINLQSGKYALPGDGVPGTGGGGSASGGSGTSGGHASCMPGGKGGSGVVILRYRTSASETCVKTVAGAGGVITNPAKHVVVHSFLEDGTLTLPEAATVDLLVVGGGGGGGAFHGGGGGGGGVTILSNLFLKAGSYAVTVGAGGAANSGAGEQSSFADHILALGGGSGGHVDVTSGQGGPGSSGGGGSTGDVYADTASERGCETYRMGGYSIDGTGFGGGSATNTTSHFQQHGGGGGGAGGPGKSSSAVYRDFGDGGIGILCDFSGEAKYYGGGGGGGASGPSNCYVGGKAGDDSAGDGGAYGSDSAKNPVPGYPGKDGRGGGGGGGGSYIQGTADGAKGGSGVVVIRYTTRPEGLMLIVN